MPLPLSPLGACLAILALWGLIGVLGLLRPSSVTLAGRTLFPVGALCGIALAVIAGLSLGLDPQEAVLVIGLPDLPMHVRLDGLASFFLVLLGATSAGVSLFAAGYFRRSLQPAASNPISVPVLEPKRSAATPSRWSSVT